MGTACSKKSTVTLLILWILWSKLLPTSTCSKSHELWHHNSRNHKLPCLRQFLFQNTSHSVMPAKKLNHAGVFLFHSVHSVLVYLWVALGAYLNFWKKFWQHKLHWSWPFVTQQLVSVAVSYRGISWTVLRNFGKIFVSNPQTYANTLWDAALEHRS